VTSTEYLNRKIFTMIAEAFLVVALVGTSLSAADIDSIIFSTRRP